MGRAIGIDLGTTRSVVVTIDGGKPRVLPNAEGQLVTPSVVSMTPQGQLLVGQRAREQALLRPEESVASIKRYMGSSRRFRLGALEYAPQELSAFVLRKLKRDAEACLGEPVEQAVISVPAYFNDRQRQATRDAGLLAGLRVLRLISEPSAAALAYGLEREDVHTVLVWDLGGGTFDVSILELGEGVFEVRAVSGDNWLGGEDFDRRVMDYLAQEYERRWRREFPRSPVAWERLLRANPGPVIWRPSLRGRGWRAWLPSC
jgi:molecular chaperone DnaK